MDDDHVIVFLFDMYFSDSVISISLIMQSIFICRFKAVDDDHVIAYLCDMYFSNSVICISVILQTIFLRMSYNCGQGWVGWDGQPRAVLCL